LRPLALELQERQLSRGHFFVRYWQGGPHARLRLLPGERPGAAAVMRREIDASTARFFAASPSSDLDPAAYRRQSEPWARLELGGPADSALEPNHSVRYVPYVPELHRYGGKEAMPLVERHFMESSDIALAVVGHDLSRGRRSVRALCMTAIAAATCNEEAGGMERFLEAIQWMWLSALPDQARDLLAQFEQRYGSQRERLAGLLPGLLEFARGRAAETDIASAVEPSGVPALASWRRSTQALKAGLDQLAANGALRVDSPFAGEPALPVLLSCLHMHHNRLGTTIPEEAYFAFLLRRAATEMTAGLA
jgi:thiopeptide-type bacteriocin biosynthesis protein